MPTTATNTEDRHPKLAMLSLRCGSEKLAGCSATYLNRAATCPSSCPLNGPSPSAPCYAARMYYVPNVTRVTENPLGREPGMALVAAYQEASLIRAAIMRSEDERPLRLRVSGDSVDERSAGIAARAAALWRRPVWTFTHSWRVIDRSAWGRIQVLGSIERPEDGRAALRRRYAPALVVAEHTSDKAHTSHGVKWIPCPSQTRNVPCAECRLCLDADSLAARSAGITFAAHGGGARKTREVLLSLRRKEVRQ